MAGPRFLLSDQDLNQFQADQWLHQQRSTLADNWLQQQQMLVPDASAVPPPAPVQAPQPPPEPSPPPDVSADVPPPAPAETPASAPSVGMQPDSPVLNLDQPAPVAPDTPLPSPSRPLPTAVRQPVAAAPPPPAAAQGLVDYARQAAARANIDPDLFVRQINQESGFRPSAQSGAGAIGVAQIVPRFHPGVDPTDPYASLDYAANLMASHLKTYGGDLTKALVAYNGGQGAVDAWNAGKPYAESVDYVNKIQGAAGGQTMASAAAAPGDISLSQFGDKTLTYDEAYAACGPAAASRLAAAYGNAIPLSTALAAAKAVGWTPGGGMNGIQNEKKLMDALNLPATLDTSGDWSKIVDGASQGMVTISTPLHYFSASGVRQRSDGQTELYVGQSGMDLKAGKAWMTPGEIETAAGKVQGALFSDPSRSVRAGDWMQQAATDHGVQTESPDQVLSALNQAKQKAGIGTPGPLEQITQPFADAFGQVGDVVGGALHTIFGSEGAQKVAAGQEAQARGLTEFGQYAGGLTGQAAQELVPPGVRGVTPENVSAVAPETGRVLTTPGAALDDVAALYQSPLRQQLAPNIGDPNHPLNAPMNTREDLIRAAPLVGGMVAPLEGGIGKLIPSEVTPPAVTGPAVARMAGTAAEQAAVGAPEEGRAANILLSKFPEDVRPHLQDVADKFGQFAGQRRGVISDPEAEANAAKIALGTTPEQWIKTPAGKAFNQEQAIALGNTLTQVGTEYDSLLKDVLAARSAGTATAEMEANLADKTLEFGALAGVRSGAAAEAGRTLRAFRQTLQSGGYANRNKAIAAAFKAIGGDKEKFAQWVEQFSTIPANDPIARYQMLQGLQKPSWWDRISILRYASMLSSTTTHMVNAFGNVINVGLDVALKPVAVGLDVARSAVTGGPRTRYMGEVAPQVQGLLDGAVAGFWDGLTALKTGINPNEAGKFENIRAGFQAGRGTTTIMGAVGGGVGGGFSAPENATPEERAARIAAGALGGAAAGAGVGSTAIGRQVVDTAVEAPLRALTFSDLVFRGAARGSQVRAIAAREGIAQGLTGDALRARINDVVTNLVQHPDIMAEAEKNAARAVLQEPNTVASAITAFGRGPGADNVAKRIVREIILPFAKTPANILNQGMEMTPYGLLKTTRLAKAGDVGGATDAAARVAFGGALMVGVGAMAANGLVTGGYPADPRERDTLPPGWQPWSLRLPNGDGGYNYISFSQLGPIAVPMAIAAVAGQSMREGVIADPVTLASSLGKFMVDQTFLQGLSSIIDAVKDPKRYGENVSEQMATSFVPYAALSREVTRILGQADRDPKGAVQAIQALIPGQAEGVPRRQDALGRDIRSTQTGIGAALSPARYSADQPEPILAAFRDAGAGLPSAPKEIRVKSQITSSTSPPMALNDREQKAYQSAFGQRLQERLLPIVSDPSWNQRSVDSRKRFLDQQVQAARDFAEAQVYRAMTPEDRQKRMQEGRLRQQVKPLPAP